MTRTKRTDVHRLSVILPLEYDFVAFEHVPGVGKGDIGACEFQIAERERIREHMAQTGGHYASHEHGGNCHVCGASAIYTILFHHRPTNTYIRTGQDCAQKMSMSYSDSDWNAFRAAIKDARAAQAGKRKAQAILADEGLSACYALYENDGWNGCECPTVEMSGYKGPECGGRCYDAWARNHREEFTIRDIVGKLVKYGSISEAQIKFLRSLLDRIPRRAELQAARAAEKAQASDCPTGRVTVSGSVLKVETKESDYGLTTKMLVKAAEGYTVYVTVPAGMRVERGYEVKFAVTLTPSDNDPKHGWGKRPVAIQTAPVAEVTHA